MTDNERAAHDARLNNIMEMWQRGEFRPSLTGRASTGGVLCEAISDLRTELAHTTTRLWEQQNEIDRLSQRSNEWRESYFTERSKPLYRIVIERLHRRFARG